LSSIAKKYGSKVSDIQRWNRLRSTTIQIGQRLIVKK
jgi:LysM repeat protein